MTSSIEVVIKLLEELNEIGISYMVGGSFASSAWGQPRQTNDLDLSVLLNARDVDALFSVVEQDYLGSKEQIIEALTSSSPFPSFQFLHIEETFKIDFFPQRDEVYSIEALKRARSFELVASKFFPFTSPEDIVLTKLRWFVLGNEVSDKQWNDVVQVLELQHGQLDTAYLERWSKWFGIDHLLARASRLASS